LVAAGGELKLSRKGPGDLPEVLMEQRRRVREPSLASCTGHLSRPLAGPQGVGTAAPLCRAFGLYLRLQRAAVRKASIRTVERLFAVTTHDEAAEHQSVQQLP